MSTTPHTDKVVELGAKLVRESTTMQSMEIVTRERAAKRLLVDLYAALDEHLIVHGVDLTKQLRL